MLPGLRGPASDDLVVNDPMWTVALAFFFARWNLCVLQFSLARDSSQSKADGAARPVPEQSSSFDRVSNHQTFHKPGPFRSSCAWTLGLHALSLPSP